MTLVHYEHQGPLFASGLVSVQLAASSPRLNSLEDLQCSAVWLRPAAARSLSARRVYPGCISSLPLPSHPPSLPAGGLGPRTNERPAASTSTCVGCLVNRSTGSDPCSHSLVPGGRHGEVRPHPMSPMSPTRSLRGDTVRWGPCGRRRCVPLSLSLLKTDMPSGRPPVHWHQ